MYQAFPVIRKSNMNSIDENVKKLLGLLTKSQQSDALKTLGNDEKYQQQLIDGCKSENDAITVMSVLLNIKNQKKDENARAKAEKEQKEAEAREAKKSEKSLKEKAEADEKAKEEAERKEANKKAEKILNRRMAARVVLHQQFGFVDDQISEILALTKCDSPKQENEILDYLFGDVCDSNATTKKVSFEMLKAVLKDKKDTYRNTSECNKWTFGDRKVKELKYDTYCYSMSFDGGLKALEKVKGKPDKETYICKPVAIVMRKINPDDGYSYHYQVEFFDESGTKRTNTLNKNELTTSAGVEKLVLDGLSIDEDKRKLLAKFFNHLLVMNKGNIPTEKTYRSWGWKNDVDDNGKETFSFIHGTTRYSLENGKLNKQSASISVGNGSDAYRKALTPKGNLADWFRSAEGLLKYPNVRFTTYACTAAPTFKLLDQLSKGLTHWGESGTGKNTNHNPGLSIYGCSSELTHNCSGSTVSIEMLLKMLPNIPFALDDAHKLHEEEKSKLAYMIGSNTGKTRSLKTADGLRDPTKFANIVLLSSEEPLHKGSALEGEMVRLIELHEGVGAIDKEAVLAFEEGAKTNYGLIAPILIEKILLLNHNGELKKIYKNCCEKLKVRYEKHTDIPISKNTEDRVIKSFGVILVGAVLFEEIMKEHNQKFLTFDDSCEICFEKMLTVITKIVESPFEMRALEVILSSVDMFIKHYQINDEWLLSPGGYNSQDIYGNYVMDTKEIQIYSNVLKKILREEKMDYNKVITQLSEKGVIKIKDDKKKSKPQLNIVDSSGNIKKERFITINAKVAEEVYKQVNPFTKAIRNLQGTQYGKQILEEGIATQPCYELQNINGELKRVLVKPKIFNDEGTQTINPSSDDIPDITDEYSNDDIASVPTKEQCEELVKAMTNKGLN